MCKTLNYIDIFIENKSNLFFETSLYDWKVFSAPGGIEPYASRIPGERPNC